MFDDVVYLVTKSVDVSDVGDAVPTYTQRMVFATKKSIRQSEFYQAQSIGLAPEIMFLIRTEEYNGEETLINDNKEYSISRPYQKRGMTEITCTRIVGDR